MKIASVRYLIGEGVKNTWANRLMTIASVGVLVACMVIIGLALLISENVAKAIGNLEQQNVVMAYMKDYNWALYGEKETEESKTASSTSSENSSANSLAFIKLSLCKNELNFLYISNLSFCSLYHSKS